MEMVFKKYYLNLSSHICALKTLTYWSLFFLHKFFVIVDTVCKSYVFVSMTNTEIKNFKYDALLIAMYYSTIWYSAWSDNLKLLSHCCLYQRQFF
jgi:hypothetical protein